MDSCLANLDRLRALDSTGAMDGPLRPDLDELTQAAASALHTPISLVTLIDDHRQFFVSAVGMDGFPEEREDGLDYSYCKHVVVAGDIVVIKDSLDDPRVVDNPATLERGIRAYLGVPITRDGHVLGSFCVADMVPRQWSDTELGALGEIADRVNALL